VDEPSSAGPAVQPSLEQDIQQECTHKIGKLSIAAVMRFPFQETVSFSVERPGKPIGKRHHKSHQEHEERDKGGGVSHGKGGRVAPHAEDTLGGKHQG
jgi:hypothetical protein